MKILTEGHAQNGLPSVKRKAQNCVQSTPLLARSCYSLMNGKTNRSTGVNRGRAVRFTALADNEIGFTRVLRVVAIAKKMERHKVVATHIKEQNG